MNHDRLIEIALRRASVVSVSDNGITQICKDAFSAEVGQLGYTCDWSAVPTGKGEIAKTKFQKIISILQEMRGGNVNYVPLFSNFPDELPNDGEYFIKRLLSFFFDINTFDNSKFGVDPTTQMYDPDLFVQAVAAQKKKLGDKYTEWKKLTCLTYTQAEDAIFKWVFANTYSSTPVKETLWEDLLYCIQELKIDFDFKNVKIKETLVRLVHENMKRGGGLTGLQTPTDLLRLFAHQCGQDVSLAQKVNLKGLKFNKPLRFIIMQFLNNCSALEEDLLRYRGLWLNISRWLHVGDYRNKFPKVMEAFSKLRENKIQSFNSQVIHAKTVKEKFELLASRPAMLIRNITMMAGRRDLAKVLGEQDTSKLPLPLLLQACAALEYKKERTIVNKQGKTFNVEPRKAEVDDAAISAVKQLILQKLENKKDWNTVWIDPFLLNVVIPFQARKQSEGLMNLARGTRIPLMENTIRTFVYWHQNEQRCDIDSSVAMLDENFNVRGRVSWSNYGSGISIKHSGDVQSAPSGASEFIDIDIEGSQSFRYLAFVIINFTGTKFSELKACYAGWMNRQEAGSGKKQFDAKTVATKVEVKADSRNWIPFVIDTKNRELIYVDIYTKGGRVVEGMDHFPALVKNLSNYSEYRPTYGMLAELYRQACGAESVERNKADVTIGMDDTCDINVLTLVGEQITELEGEKAASFSKLETQPS